MLSVLSTAMSRLNTFLDSELEQVLCFDSAIDAEKFCTGKQALFHRYAGGRPTSYFLVSLIIQQLYRELMTVADEHGGRLPNRVIFFADEFGTIPKLEGAEMLFSAARSRASPLLPSSRGSSSWTKTTGKRRPDHPGQLPADHLRRLRPGQRNSGHPLQGSGGTDGPLRLGEQGQGQQLPQYADDGPPPHDPDELKSMPKGTFITMKTGMPMMTQFQLFLKWGISLEAPIRFPDAARKVEYAGRVELVDFILKQFGDTEAVNIPHK